MTLISGVHHVDQATIRSVVQQASGVRAHVTTVSASGGSGRAGIFDAIRQNLPLEPPLLSDRSWDALSDSLWAGIDSLDAQMVVIVWPNFAEMTSNDFHMRQIVISILQDVTRTLADPVITNGRPKEVCIYLGTESRSEAAESGSGDKVP
jgi:hypothetical protein